MLNTVTIVIVTAAFHFSCYHNHNNAFQKSLLSFWHLQESTGFDEFLAALGLDSEKRTVRLCFIHKPGSLEIWICTPFHHSEKEESSQKINTSPFRLNNYDLSCLDWWLKSLNSLLFKLFENFNSANLKIIILIFSRI